MYPVCSAIRRFRLVALLGLSVSIPNMCPAQQESIITLKNGMVIGPGASGSVSGVDQSPTSAAALSGETKAKPVTIVDDSLRMTFFRSSQIININDRVEPPTVLKTGNLRAHGNHPRVLAVESVFGSTPFDDFGRRIYSLTTNKDVLRIQQGITEISSKYVRVEGLEGEQTILWDMRLPLNGIPADQLRTILFNQVDLSVAQNWLDIVTIFRQADRYREAREILQLAIARHPELEHLKPKLREFDEANAALMFREVEIREKAGQYQLASELLMSFDRRNVANVTNSKIENRLTNLKREDKAISELKARCRKLLENTADTKLKSLCKIVVDEIESQVSYDTIGRFSDLQQIPEAEDQRALAVAVSGWLLGGGSAVNSLAVAGSLAQARELISEYLSTTDSSRREAIIGELRSIEGGTTPYIAKLAKLLRPPKAFEGEPISPGRYEVEIPITAIPGSPKPTVRYIVQLPPEYDPNRKYPCILTLQGELSTAEDQVNWWSGQYNGQFKRCMGEASRYGYVVVAPQWSAPKQPFYNYSENEHAAILASLRDACRHASIDTNRVYLSGHYMGADAAWDIGLAHPDLWAGMIVIGGNCEKYPVLYYENGKPVPMYFIMGELDGAPNPLSRNGKYLDKFLGTSQFDCMVVVYRGRGRDHFQEELSRIMQWTELSAHRRSFSPQNIEFVTARGGDNFFWFLELNNISENVLIHPIKYAPRNLPKIDATLRKPAANAVRVGPLPAQGFTLWLSPSHVQDINQRILVETTKGTKQIAPELDIKVILEDLRQRVDREEPFWIRAEF